jgi:hypothetical protein
LLLSTRSVIVADPEYPKSNKKGTKGRTVPDNGVHKPPNGMPRALAVSMVSLTFNVTRDEQQALRRLSAKKYKGKITAQGVAAAAVRGYLIQEGLVDNHGHATEKLTEEG